MPRYNNYAFIDEANLHQTYEHLDWKLDYQELLNHLRKKLGINVAFYFIGRTPNNEDVRQNLDSYGYTIKLKEPSPYKTDKQHCPHCEKLIAHVDSFITLTVSSNLHLFDKAVLITSDGDFDELVKMLLRQEKLRMVFAPTRDGCSKLLKKVAIDKIGFIDDFRTALEKV